jgi:hypothetical protein
MLFKLNQAMQSMAVEESTQNTYIFPKKQMITTFVFLKRNEQ